MASIRKYLEGDREAVYRICLQTGDAGKDATAIYHDPKLLGHVYAGPYLEFAPDCAFVLEDQHGVGGYVIGVPDTHKFERTLEVEWWPALRKLYTDPTNMNRDSWSADDRIVRLIHHPPRTPRRIAETYPAHLHIDLLPRLQSQGLGAQMLDRWLRRMREAGSAGMHLGVGMANERAIRFYRSYGLAEIERLGPPFSVVYFGTKL